MSAEKSCVEQARAEWGNIASRLKAVFNFGIKKAEWLQTSRMPRFIAAIPFLAGCSKGVETAFSHLSIYLMSIDESAKEIFFHNPTDDEDIFNRLFPVSNFKDGKKDIIQCCMDLLALNMISDYKKDADDDKIRGKYNPLIDGNWDFVTISERLIQNINKNITPEISEFYTVDDACKGFWQG